MLGGERGRGNKSGPFATNNGMSVSFGTYDGLQNLPDLHEVVEGVLNLHEVFLICAHFLECVSGFVDLVYNQLARSEILA